MIEPWPMKREYWMCAGASVQRYSYWSGTYLSAFTKESLFYYKSEKSIEWVNSGVIAFDYTAIYTPLCKKTEMCFIVLQYSNSSSYSSSVVQ